MYNNEWLRRGHLLRTLASTFAQAFAFPKVQVRPNSLQIQDSARRCGQKARRKEQSTSASTTQRGG